MSATMKEPSVDHASTRGASYQREQIPPIFSDAPKIANPPSPTGSTASTTSHSAFNSTFTRACAMVGYLGGGLSTGWSLGGEWGGFLGFTTGGIALYFMLRNRT